MPLSGHLRSITAMLGAVAMFSCMDTLLKALAGTYSPLQVTALRGLTAMPPVCVYVLWRREVRAVSRPVVWVWSTLLVQALMMDAYRPPV